MIESSKGEISVTVRTGIASFDDAQVSLESVVANFNAALYLASMVDETELNSTRKNQKPL